MKNFFARYMQIVKQTKKSRELIKENNGNNIKGMTTSIFTNKM